MFFDGGCESRKGYGAFVAYDQNRKQIGGWGKYYGATCPTNNEAELSALLDGLTWITEMEPQLAGVTSINVIGDSELVINFLKGHAKASKVSLAAKVR